MSLRIFLSHIHEEAEVARAIADELARPFAEMVDVFLSTKIPLGSNWLTAVGAELERCQIVLVLFTPYSLPRPWINIEAGFGVFANKHVVPMCGFGLSRDELPTVYNALQGIDVLNAEDVRRLLNDLASGTAAKRFLGDVESAVQSWMQNVAAAAARIPRNRRPEGGAPICVWLMGSTTDFQDADRSRAFDVVDAVTDEIIKRRFRIVQGSNTMLAYAGDRVASGVILPDPHKGKVRLGAKAARAAGKIVNPVTMLGSLRNPRGVRHAFLDALGIIPDVAVMIGGLPGGRAAEEARLAAEAGIPLLPIPFSGGAAGETPCTFDPSLADETRRILDRFRGADEIGPLVCDVIEKQVAISVERRKR